MGDELQFFHQNQGTSSQFPLWEPYILTVAHTYYYSCLGDRPQPQVKGCFDDCGMSMYILVLEGVPTYCHTRKPAGGAFLGLNITRSLLFVRAANGNVQGTMSFPSHVQACFSARTIGVCSETKKHQPSKQKLYVWQFEPPQRRTH